MKIQWSLFHKKEEVRLVDGNGKIPRSFQIPSLLRS